MLKKHLGALCALSVPALVLGLPDLAAGAGAAGVDYVVYVADSRGHTGLRAWFANLYNESGLWFTAVTVITIPVTGVVLGLLADLGMSRIGIDLRSREKGEH